MIVDIRVSMNWESENMKFQLMMKCIDNIMKNK